MQKTATKYAQLDQYKNVVECNRVASAQGLSILAAFLLSFCLTLILLISGCMAQITAKEAMKMSPEQIAAYKDSGFKVFSCFRLSGPPPSGSELFIILPKESVADFIFLPDCSIMPTKVTQ